MMTWIGRHPFTLFYALSVLIAFAVVANGIVVMSSNADAAAAFAYLGGDIANAGGYVNLPWIVHFALQQPTLFGILVFAAAPTIAAVIVAALTGRLARLGRLFKPYQGRALRGRAAVTYGAIAGVYLAGLALFSWLTFVHAGGAGLSEAWSALGSTGLAALPIALFAMVLDEGGTLEEAGWRGFLQDLFSDRYAPLVVALSIGALWWAWHLPREIVSILSGVALATFLWNQFIFLLLCVAMSIVITFAWNRVGGSIWIGLLIHGGTNVWSKAFGAGAWEVYGGAMARIHPALQSLDLRTLIVLILAGLVLGLAGPRLGRAGPP